VRVRGSLVSLGVWFGATAPRRLKVIVLFLRSLLLHNEVFNHGAVEVKQEETGGKHDDAKVFKSLGCIWDIFGRVKSDLIRELVS
jgi:hypothetical protein